MSLFICPRCKRRCLNKNDCGESAIYKSRHLLCVGCWHDEDEEIEREGTNNLPHRLLTYGPANDHDSPLDTLT